MPHAKRTDDATEPNFVAFRAAGEDYCIDIMAVREIRGWGPVTALPKVAPYILGVINLRGSVVPILNFSLRLGLAASPPTAKHVVIIVRIGQQTVGLFVDEVLEILTVAPESIQPTPDVGLPQGEALVAGLIKMDDRLIRQIELDLLFPAADRGLA